MSPTSYQAAPPRRCIIAHNLEIAKNSRLYICRRAIWFSTPRIDMASLGALRPLFGCTLSAQSSSRWSIRSLTLERTPLNSACRIDAMTRSASRRPECLFQDRNVRVGVFPKREEILRRRLGFDGVALHGIGVHHAAIWGRTHFWLRR